MADIFLEHKIVLMHNPKCGSRNLRMVALHVVEENPTKYIGSRNNDTLLFVNKKFVPREVKQSISSSVPVNENYTYDHCNVLGMYRFFEKFNIEPTGFNFLYVIRHPQTRYISGYRYSLKRGIMDKSVSFSDYIHHNLHIKGATNLNDFTIDKFSLGPGGVPHIHHVVKLENFKEGLLDFFESRGFQMAKVPFDLWNNSSRDYVLDQKLRFSSKDIDFIEEHWKEDIRLGGYEIDPNMEV